jgi:hypothetical protein
MKSILEGDRRTSSGRMTSNLDRVLDGLHHCWQTSSFWKIREPIIELGQLHTTRTYDVKAGMNKLLDLILDGLHDGWITMAYVVDANPSCKVDVFFAFHVGDDGSLRLLRKNGMGIEGTLSDVFEPFSE